MTTPNLGLSKPADTDEVDIDIINGNMDTLDTAVAEKAVVAEAGDFPEPIGTSNTVGTSEFASRADHIHRLSTADRALLDSVVTDAPTVVDLVDGATPALDASSGSYFRLAAAGSRTIAVPSNPTDGQAITIEHLASGGARTLALNSGTGGFAFGDTITALTATDSGARDFIRAIYNSSLNKWLVVGYVKGF